MIDDSGPHTLFTIHNGGAEYNLHIVETKMQDIKMYVRINIYDGQVYHIRWTGILERSGTFDLHCSTDAMVSGSKGQESGR